jgi:hypothetical protein
VTYAGKGGITERRLSIDPGLQRVEKRLAEKICEINLPFEEELKTIEED